MNNVVPFDQQQSSLPAHLAALGSTSLNTDLSSGVGTGFPVVSFKGKVWHVQQGDERTLLTNPQTGDPMQSIEVVILKANPNLSKIYYSGGYTEGSTEKPDCYSNDGVAPAADAQRPQSAKCATCPHNQWGSRITEMGAKGKACSDSRRLAIAPADDIEHPMLLRIPAATLKDLTNYAELLNRRRAPYTAVVTRISFDHTVAYPKLVFRASRWVEANEANLIADVIQRDVVSNIVGIGNPNAQAVDNSMGDDAGVGDLPPPPVHVTGAAQPAKPAADPASAGPSPRFAAKEEEVAEVIQTRPAPTPKPEPEPEQSAPAVQTIIANAESTLADALRLLDSDD